MLRKTSIILLTHNQLEYTKLCVKSIRRHTNALKYEIIVVDNASTDQTTEWLRKQKDIKCIFNSENKGFSAGCNQGIRKSNGTEILLLNNDTIVMPNWLRNLRIALYSSDKIGAVGPVSNSCSNLQAINVNYESDNFFKMLEFGKNYNQISNSQKWQEKVKLIGFCMLIKKSVVDKVGFLDEQFFPGNFEDDDYSLRIIKAGYDLLQCNDTFIHHFGGVSFKGYNQKYANIIIENHSKFFNKWGIDSISSIDNISEYNSLNLCAGMHILEIGCSCGAALLELKSKNVGINIYGIDKRKTAVQIANHYFPAIYGDIETMNLSYGKEFFDYILLPDYITKVKKPVNVLKKLVPYLKDNGEIVVSAYNIMHYDNLRKILSGDYLYKSDLVSDVFSESNIRFLNLYSLKKIIEDAGLKIGHCESIVKFDEDINYDNDLVKTILSTNLVPKEKHWELKVYKYIMHLKHR
ncbi:glycosyltransferase [Pectinatus sottacetonis]|uniref:glycosyltransferase n=1 Tax=Pectinatus sottacetonis TaxID=1002795 RepID=UPI0018C6BAB4|nr:glycosyltransferase [Pectinatus sottacetonis]